MMRGKNNLIRGTKTRPQSEGGLCSYSHRTCMLNRLEGFDFCLKHILEDKTAPYKQCSFVSNRKARRCPNAASKVDRKDSFCLEHARKASILRQKAGMKKRPKETSESLLEELASCNNQSASTDTASTLKRSRLPSDSIISKVLDYATSSDSEAEAPQVDQSWRGDGDSDAESIDSEQEDVLKHAGVYTAEEVALILRDKLIRLQSLYIDQFKRLQHIMKEKRRKYLHTYKHDREMFGSIKVYKKDPAQSHKYQKLKALKKYHNRCGKEALLHRQSKERRIAVSEGPNYKAPSYPKCCYVDDVSVKCGQRTIPLSKYCAKHILHDPKQVFFQPCCFADGACGRPVAGYMDPPFCSLHVPLSDAELRIQNVGSVCNDISVADEIKQELETLRQVKEESADVDVESPAILDNLFAPDKLMENDDDISSGIASDLSLIAPSTISMLQSSEDLATSSALIPEVSSSSLSSSSSQVSGVQDATAADAPEAKSSSSGVLSASETSLMTQTATPTPASASEHPAAEAKPDPPAGSEIPVSSSETSQILSETADPFLPAPSLPNGENCSEMGSLVTELEGNEQQDEDMEMDI